MEWVCLRGGVVARRHFDGCLAPGEPALVPDEMGRSRRVGDASLVPLAEKSVSPGRTLDKRCYFHHTVVYLIRYAML